MNRNRLSLAIGLTLFIGTANSQAQDAANTDKPASKSTSTTLEAVKVTARRREETLQDVPVAVTAFTPEAIDKLNVRDIGDLDAQVPNLTIYAARGSNSTITAYIRGVGQSDPLWGVDPGVGLYLDDVYIARPQGGLLDVFDVGRIEVLRGPQGTLYGKNTIGGAIKYISRDLPKDTEGFASLTVGNYNELDFKGALGGPVGDNVRMRLAVASLNRDGFGKNVVTGEDVSDKDIQAMRYTAGYFGDDDVFNLRFAYDYTKDDSGVRGAQMLTTNFRDPASPDTLPLNGRYDVRNGMPNVNETTLSGSSVTATWKPNDNWVFKSTTAYRESDTATYIDFDTLQAQLTDVKAFYNDNQLSQEFQAAYDAAGKSHGVFGLYWFKGKAGGLVQNIFLKGADIPPFFPNPPGPGFPGQFGDTRGDVDTKSIAIYGDWIYDFTDKLSMSTGLRWTKEEKHANVLNRSYANDTFSVPTGTVAFDKKKTFINLSPKVSLDYKLTDDTLLYGLFARGFKSGGYNIRASVLPNSQEPYDDEQVDSLEIGSKMAFFDQRMFLNLAYFHNKYKDIQLSVFTTCVVGGVPTFCADFTNAGQGTVSGAELELQLRPNEHWFISGNLAVLDAKFDEFIFKGVNIADQQEFTNAPDFSGAVNVEYMQPLANGGNLSFRVGYSYQSEVAATTEITQDPVTGVITNPIHQDGYGLLSAGIQWKTASDWSLSLQGSNLTDKHYLTTGYVIPSTGVRTGFYGNPRQISLTARFEF
ncbi:MAG: TonB-dependent receptor [Arenimonas sp.]